MTSGSRVLRALAAALVALGGAAPAATITAANVDGVAKALQDNGYKAKVDRTDKDGPWIITASAGNNFGIAFSDCQGPNKCRLAEFVASYSDVEQEVGKSIVDDWNSKEQFSGAVYDPARRSIVAYHYLLTGDAGISDDAFIGAMNYFIRDFDDLGRQVVERSKPAAEHRPYGDKDPEGEQL
jgi:hypothetical protein